jgi:hypothetical protein
MTTGFDGSGLSCDAVTVADASGGGGGGGGVGADDGGGC